MLLERELLDAKIAARRCYLPFGLPEVAAMSRTVSPSSGKPYGLARVCRVWRASRAFAKEIARGLAVRHDHGSQYMSDAFQQELAFLGIESSPAFSSAPKGNGCAERFIRTLKENLRSHTFDTVEELRQALLDFREIYNTTWLIERHGFQTPAAVRQNQPSTAARAA